MFFEITRIIDAKRPKVVFLENVPNLIEHDDGRTFLVIFNSLAQFGYNVYYRVMAANEYGNVPAAKRDIAGNPIVIILASTFSEYLYNHIYHDLREIDYKDFDDIIVNNLGKDISKLISNMTMEKFAARS